MLTYQSTVSDSLHLFKQKAHLAMKFSNEELVYMICILIECNKNHLTYYEIFPHRQFFFFFFLLPDKRNLGKLVNRVNK